MKKHNTSSALMRFRPGKKTFAYKIKIFLFCILTFVTVVHCTVTSMLNSSNIKVTAHRGSCIFSPENTVASVIEAITLGVDYVEIDVQLTKDGQIILLHDSSFERTAGVKAHPWELTYDEILNLNVEEHISSTFPIHTIPLLEEIIRLCPNSVILNIELKNYGHSQDLPQKIVEIIEENNFIDNCIISSSSITLLKEVNRLNHQIKTGIITSSPIKYLHSENNFLDIYIINYIALTPELSLYIHSLGKEIYCWTPNSKIAIEYAIHSGADNIITDKIALANLLILQYQK